MNIEQEDRRIEGHFDEREAYQALSLKRAMQRERRADYLEKLIEIQEQRKVYFTVLGLCLL